MPGNEEERIRVHAVVPARNEVDVITATVRSLVAQQFHGAFSITLVDDHSTDGTATAARDEIALHPDGHQLEIITADPLAAGWTGKLGALESGVRHVRAHHGSPDFWLFTDADIRHEPGNVRALTAWARRDRLDLASWMVRLHCDPVNPWERLLIPAFVYFFMQLYPFRWARSPAHATAAAAGGCVLISDAALTAIGGLAAIHDRIIDDCSLAAAVKSTGRRIDLRLTGSAFSDRPYEGLGVIWNMVKRSAFTQLRESYGLAALTAAGMTALYLVPPAAVAAGALGRRPRLFGIGALAWGLMTLTYLPTVKMYGLKNRDALLLPLAALLYTAMTLDSASAHARKRGGAWKGRTYSI
jgi:hopene-associated glycosyltransferase HpnB